MTEAVALRPATMADALPCAAIYNDWIDATEWMPRLHPKDGVERFYRDKLFANCEVTIAGDPVDGFLAFEPKETFIEALYVAAPGHGIGKALLDHAKKGRVALQLWAFQANTGARAFYKREGFSEAKRTEGDNMEGLPDVLLRWEAA